MTQNAALQTIEPAGAEVELLAEWTPESLEKAIEREKQLRSLVVAYCKSAMTPSHHYYNLPGSEGRKPALSKEGALNLCSLFKATPSPDEINETFHADGHYTVRARTHIIGRNGAILATGDGLCTSRESKYAHRWMWGSEVPADVNKDDLKKKEWSKGDRKFVQYQVPNQDLADIFNTVLKMAAKRAMVDAVLKLPLVSELFTQDLDEQLADNVNKKQQETTTRESVKDDRNRTAKNSDIHTSNPPNKPKSAEEELADEAALSEQRENARQLIEITIGEDPADVKKFLKGRQIDLMPVDALQRLVDELKAL